MYSFLPKLTQQLKHLANTNNPDPSFELPAGPGDVYKNLLGMDADKYYKKYNNEWTVYDNDNQGWKGLPSSYPEMLNNIITTDKGKQALYFQGNPEYQTAQINNTLNYNPLQGLNMPNINSAVTLPGTAGVLANNNPYQNLSTPELDTLMGKTETPYTMDYTPFASEEEMNKYYNPPSPDTFLPDNTPYEAILNNENEQLGIESGAAPEQYNAPEPISISFNKFQGAIPYNIDLSKIAKNMPLPLPYVSEADRYKNLQGKVKNWMGNVFDGTETEPETDQYTTPLTKNNFGLADSYYLGNSILNATALMNNMVQPEPPSIQMKIPHFERLRLNPEPYDAMRSQIGEQSNAAYRLSRENISQASDLMKSLSAVTSGTQQAIMNVGLNQAAATQQIQDKNQQISMQEQGIQTDTLNNEALTNWKIQDEHYKAKGQAISSALAALSQTGGQFVKYKTMQDIISKQDALNKSAAELNNEMQANLLQYEISETALGSQEYKDYYKAQRSAEQEKINKELLGDDKYRAFNDYYSGVIPSYSSYEFNIDSPESQEKLRTIAVAKRFQSEYPLGAAPDIKNYPNDKEGYDAAVKTYNQYKAYSDRYANDPKYKAYEAEQAFWKESLQKFNESELRKSTAESYLKSRGLPTQTELLQKLKAISERGAQRFG